MCACVCVSVRIQQTSDNEPHPGSLKGAVSHIAGTVDALIGKCYIIHCQYSCAIYHIIPVSHVIVVSYTKETKKNINGIGSSVYNSGPNKSQSVQSLWVHIV